MLPVYCADWGGGSVCVVAVNYGLSVATVWCIVYLALFRPTICVYMYTPCPGQPNGIDPMQAQSLKHWAGIGPSP